MPPATAGKGHNNPPSENETSADDDGSRKKEDVEENEEPARQKGDRFKQGNDAQQQYEEIDSAQRKARKGKSKQFIESTKKSKHRADNELRQWKFNKD